MWFFTAASLDVAEASQPWGKRTGRRASRLPYDRCLRSSEFRDLCYDSTFKARAKHYGDLAHRVYVDVLGCQVWFGACPRGYARAKTITSNGRPTTGCVLAF